MPSYGVTLNETVVEFADRLAAISSNMVTELYEMLRVYKLDVSIR